MKLENSPRNFRPSPRRAPRNLKPAGRRRRKTPTHTSDNTNTVRSKKMELREWETIKSTPGGYLGGRRKPGQNVIGYVAEYSIDEGTDFRGNKCPHLVLELTEDTLSFNKDADHAEHQSGEFINITCAQASLTSAIRRTDPSPADLLRITLTDLAN